MTPSNYLIARVALAFGFNRRTRRLSEAASETHLLREAELILGRRVWKHVEEVEQLGIEYWNLRRLSAKRTELLEIMKSAEGELESAHEQRAEVLSAKSSKQQELEDERGSLLEELEQLARKRDQVIARAREVRRLYDGLKTKLEVLSQESDQEVPDLDKSRKRMTELRNQFDELKIERDSIAALIREKDQEMDTLETKITAERNLQREEASESFQVIGDANRRISSTKAELGVIETKMQQLYSEIGRHVSLHFRSDPRCQAAVRDHKPLVEVMVALRKSIILNQKLAEFT
jgi:chromosome segregation ATPase